ncbi:MGH1-like glycoside hydrolase domain-containing protein [Streptomyces sp. CA-106110]|uniref:MGH1-like glycoside hydrolase domain-containing protein n=1 Tax=Streptomyces sp. CA-106110 TaxID=3240044 RepID=UPI003D8A67A6
MFTENDTNNERIFGSPNATPYVKDGIDRYIVHGETGAVNPRQTGTKASVHHVLTVPAGDSTTVRLRLTDIELADPWAEFHQLLDTRRSEADVFFEGVVPDGLAEDERRMVRQALAGMLWSKQYYYLDVERWLAEHGVDPLAADPRIRNSAWYHMVNDEVILMPDTWEYPWFAAWDLAFHTIALSMVDIGFAKAQLELLLRRLYLHPNGQIPAYEWNFGDVNPPVHAWAVFFVYELEKHRTGRGDRVFLENAFQKLMKNFNWWLNRKDIDGNNVFQGGFLGLDNIGVFDRSAPLPTGGHLDQADGTAWMALYCQNLLEIAIELADGNRVYVEHAQILFEHFAWIAVAMNHIGDENQSLWDEEDGFFYDVLRLPDDGATRLKVRSLVGLIPLAATSVISGWADQRFPEMAQGAQEFVRRHPAVEAFVSSHHVPG